MLCLYFLFDKIKLKYTFKRLLIKWDETSTYLEAGRHAVSMVRREGSEVCDVQSVLCSIQQHGSTWGQLWKSLLPPVCRQPWQPLTTYTRLHTSVNWITDTSLQTLLLIQESSMSIDQGPGGLILRFNTWNSQKTFSYQLLIFLM